MSRPEMSAADRRVLASLPSCHLDTARVLREQIVFDRAVDRLLVEAEAESGRRLGDPVARAAWTARYIPQHAPCLASAAAARRAAARLGVARLPG